MFIPQTTAQTGLLMLEQLVSKALAFTTVPSIGAPHTLEAAIMPSSAPADLIAIDLVDAPGVATGAAATLQSLALLLNKGLLEGAPSLSGELVTLSSALPNEVWNLVFSHLNSQQLGVTQVSLTEAAFDGLPPTDGVLLDVESAITLVGVGVGVLDAVPL